MASPASYPSSRFLLPELRCQGMNGPTLSASLMHLGPTRLLELGLEPKHRHRFSPEGPTPEYHSEAPAANWLPSVPIWTRCLRGSGATSAASAPWSLLLDGTWPAVPAGTRKGSPVS